MTNICTMYIVYKIDIHFFHLHFLSMILTFYSRGRSFNVYYWNYQIYIYLISKFLTKPSHTPVIPVYNGSFISWQYQKIIAYPLFSEYLRQKSKYLINFIF